MAITNKHICVEVVYALPERQWLASVELEHGSTAREAVQAAAPEEAFPELKQRHVALAIWGQQVDGAHVLRAGDRVEILRPLCIDPRAARRQLAAQGLVMGQRGSKLSSD